MAIAMKNANDRTPATFTASTIVVGDEGLCGEKHLFSLWLGSCLLLSSLGYIYKDDIILLLSSYPILHYYLGHL